MSRKEKLMEALADFTGDENIANELLEDADAISRTNEENELIVRENEEAEQGEEEEVETEAVEEEVEEEEVEEEEIREVEYELDIGDELVELISERVLETEAFSKLTETLRKLGDIVREIQEEVNDDKPIKARKVIRPTMRGQEPTDESEDDVELNINDKKSILQRRRANLAALRRERNSKKEVNKVD